MSDLPVVHLPEGWEDVIAPFERQSRLIDLLDACVDNAEARSELAAAAPLDWAEFCAETAPSFAKAAAPHDRDLATAIELWAGLRVQRADSRDRQAAWEDRLRRRRHPLAEAFSPEFPLRISIVDSEGHPVARIETSSAVGCVLEYDAGHAVTAHAAAARSSVQGAAQGSWPRKAVEGHTPIGMILGYLRQRSLLRA